MNNRDDLDDFEAKSIDDAVIAHQDLTKFREARFLDRGAGLWEPAQSIDGLSEAVDCRRA